MLRKLIAIASAAGLCTVALVTSLAGPASSGTFPGANARIAVAAEADQQGNDNIYSVNPDGTGLTRLSTATVDEQSPSWSGDGSKIAFSVDNLGNPGDLVVMNADGSGRTIIYTDSVDYIDEVSFSPDGSRIAFTTSGSNTPAVQVINADGTGRIPLGPYTSGVAWSPDGTKIASHDGQRFVLVNADGSGATPTNITGVVFSPCFSPDGTKLTFMRLVSGVYRIFAANLDGTGEVQISVDPTVYAFSPSFSPDGTKIAYTQNGALITANADGSGGQVTVLPGSSGAFGTSWAAIAVPPAPAPDPSAPKFTG